MAIRYVSKQVIVCVGILVFVFASPISAQKTIDTPFGQITPKADGFNFKGRFLEVDRSKDATVLKSPLGEIRKDRFYPPYAPLTNIPPRPDGLPTAQIQVSAKQEVIIPPYRFAEDVGIPELGSPASTPGDLTPSLGAPSTAPDTNNPPVPQLGSPGGFENDVPVPYEPKPPQQKTSRIPVPNLGVPGTLENDRESSAIPQKKPVSKNFPLVPVLGQAQTFDGKPLTPPPEPMPPNQDREPGKLDEHIAEPNPSYLILPYNNGIPSFQVTLNGVAQAAYAKPAYSPKGRARRIANLVVPAGGLQNAAVNKESISLEPMWLEEVPAVFQPIAGVHVFAFVHPVTNKTTTICVELPEGKPTIEIMAREVAFDYGAHNIKIKFKRNGMRVIYNN